jgi:hypothetical protein
MPAPPAISGFGVISRRFRYVGAESALPQASTSSVEPATFEQVQQGTHASQEFTELRSSRQRGRAAKVALGHIAFANRLSVRTGTEAEIVG